MHGKCVNYRQPCTKGVKRCFCHSWDPTQQENLTKVISDLIRVGKQDLESCKICMYVRRTPSLTRSCQDPNKFFL